MDLVSECKEKLSFLRVKDLKDVLTQLGLSKQGRKQDLVERILAILSDEQLNERVYGKWAKKSAAGKQEVARVVDDTFRKMSGGSDLPSTGQCMSDNSSVKPKEELEDSHPTYRIRCLCGSSLQTDSMVECEDPRCHVWQHIGCVIIPDKPLGGPRLAHPYIFYCELCRLARADPFLVAVAHPLYPVSLTTTAVPMEGTNPMQSVEKTFQLTRADKDLLLKQEYDVQAWCMLLNDKVPFRMQWPQYVDLQINGVPVRVINRPVSQLLGTNGRDDGPIITHCTRDGINKIKLSGCDSRRFCLGVRIVKRRTLQQILNMIPREADGEQFGEALARICRCVGGGAATENADSDSDLEIVSDSIPVNLRCPMSGSRMKVAGRFKPCLHMGCFDLEIFVEMNQRSRKWQCPICLNNYSLESIIIDPYFNRISSKMQNCGEDVAEIEVKPDGSWRVKAEGNRRDLGDLVLWHFPDGSLCLSQTETEFKPEQEALNNIIEEDAPETHCSLKIGIKKNPNGGLEMNKPEFSSEIRVENCIPMSISASGSGRDSGDASVNLNGCGNFDFSASNAIELDSFSPNIEQFCGFPSTNTAPFQNSEVIVLSDSDDDNGDNNHVDTGGVTIPLQPTGISDPYPEEYPLFDSNGWPLPPAIQTGSSFQNFTSFVDDDVDIQHGSIQCPTSTNGYMLTAETSDMNHGLVYNPLAFNRDDPSLQIFLPPTRHPDASVQPTCRDQPDVPNSLRSDDWISLRLGDCDANDGQGQSAAANGGVNIQQNNNSNESPPYSMANTASLLLDTRENMAGNTNKEKSDSPFSFPRQRRSVRPRLYLSIDSDSD